MVTAAIIVLICMASIMAFICAVLGALGIIYVSYELYQSIRCYRTNKAIDIINEWKQKLNVNK